MYFRPSHKHFVVVKIVAHVTLRFALRFVLVKFRQDTIVQPIETEWFQFYSPNQDQIIQPLAESAVAVSRVKTRFTTVLLLIIDEFSTKKMNLVLTHTFSAFISSLWHE